MRSLAVYFALGCAVALRAQDAAAPPVIVETDVTPATAFVGQPVQLRLRIAVERQFLAQHVLQPFRQHLDVPLRVAAPWLDALAGARALPAPEPGERALTLVANGELAHAMPLPDREIDGRHYTVVELTRSVVPTRPGSLVAAGAQVHAMHATRFRESFLGDRVAEDPQTSTFAGEGLALRIEALPVAGRPPGFGGAVGDFRIGAQAAPAVVELGAALRLTVTIRGDGDLESIAAPPLDRFADFHVLGRIDATTSDGRTFTWELVPLRDDLREVPSVELPFFDPQARAYRVATSEPLPLQVLPSADGARRVALLAPAALAEPEPRDGDELAGPIALAGDLPADVQPLPRSLVLAGFVLPWLAAALWIGIARWRRLRRIDPAVERTRRALAALREAAARRPADAGLAFADFLAARSGGTSGSMMIGPAGRERLLAAGLSPTLAARAVASLDGLLASRYGGPDDAGDPRELLELAAEIDTTLAKAGLPR